MSTTGEQVVIRLEGVFDAEAAQRLSAAIETARGEDITVDLTDVREFHDFGIAMLARALSGPHRVAVSGLRHHQLRLLRYFGIDAEPADLGRAVELQ
ncbi:MAG TPA: STAS domain-containing protein [Anaeromyxobacter sp.]